jgi:protein SCO1
MVARLNRTLAPRRGTSDTANSLILVVLIFLVTAPTWAARQYSATGMILTVDKAHRIFVASCQPIPGFMEAMSMPFEVREAKELDGLAPGNIVDFTLEVDGSTSFAQNVKLHPYVSAEQDPWLARQLKLLKSLSNPRQPAPKQLAIGSTVPNFTLTDQARRQVSFSQFAGRVVALNFIYTSCALPTFCFRTANNFGVLQRRLKDHLGRDLILLTVSFDPQRDTPEVLARYARTWKADAQTWHFLTGPLPEVRRVTAMFGMDFFPDEGLMNHSLHSVVIDRQGKIVANIEGNQYTADQLLDLVTTIIYAKSVPHH